MGELVYWNMKVDESTRVWFKNLSRETGMTIGRVLDDLHEAYKMGLVKYENRVWHGEESNKPVDTHDLEVKHDVEIANLQTKIALLEAKVRGLAEENNVLTQENNVLKNNALKLESQNFSEKQKETPKETPIDLRELYSIAEKRQITPESLLSVALRPFRC